MITWGDWLLRDELVRQIKIKVRYKQSRISRVVHQGSDGLRKQGEEPMLELGTIVDEMVCER